MYRFKLILAILLFSFISVRAGEPQTSAPDTINSVKQDSLNLDRRLLTRRSPDENTKAKSDSAESRNWLYLLKRGRLNLADKSVEYPPFLRFCVDVYNWADKTFNSYDTTYVTGTGHRWKARLLSDNWAESYYLNIDRSIPIYMMSHVYSNIGAYIQYMAVSLGYSHAVNNIVGHNYDSHRKLEFNFSCARFNIEGHYWENAGDIYIHRFGNFNNGRLFSRPFSGAKQKVLGLTGYYFFNNRKFALGAAYNFSKFQKRSAGSPIIGLSYSNTDITMDLTKLPPELLPYLTRPPVVYRFHYNSYCLMGGYSFNWVITPRLLFNISVFPGVGYTHSYEDAVEKGNRLVAMTLKGQSSVTYNIEDFFICAVAKFDGNWYRSGHYSFISAVENFQLSLGYRFW